MKIKPKITEIEIVPIKPKNGIVGFASFVLNDVLYLGSIAIMTKLNGGYRLVYPTKKIGDRRINIYHPIERNFSLEIEKVVIEKFENLMKKYDRYNSFDA
ncbi:MAG: SpoVG family protein [Patescibacteria group bacterium]|nr:SpoVG family protein [Patescibacteria group bacterium]MCX7881010.1 SpoVG family protein [Patescibacteria group bacterium]